ncbi:MAG: glycosyltransferase family 2 protein [Dysgonamonadaceae bacterium]|jgi:GT2 family glycosyltransferase|nr:glycosyltransferase family 2 protein [Dysgonamonadaceae bacterium]
MKLSVIIVNYNVKYFLEQCLHSVFKSIHDLEAEVIVIDNNSSDNSVEYLQSKFPEVHYITNKENVGFSKANNQGIEISEGEYVLILNPDTVIAEDTLVNVCRFMDTHPETGAVGVKMINGYGNFLPESKRGFPSPWNSFCKMSGLSKLFPRSSRFGQYHLRYLDENSIHQVDVLAGAFMLLRREALKKVGLLDETFFMYGEDIDLSYRIVQGGYKNYYLPERIIHYKGESTRKDFKYVKHFYQAMLIFHEKHYPEAGIFHKWLIHLAVNTKAVFSVLGKLFPIKKKEQSKRNNAEVFNTNDISYKELINRMDKHPRKDFPYKIYNPETGITISSNEVIID